MDAISVAIGLLLGIAVTSISSVLWHRSRLRVLTERLSAREQELSDARVEKERACDRLRASEESVTALTDELARACTEKERLNVHSRGLEESLSAQRREFSDVSRQREQEHKEAMDRLSAEFKAEKAEAYSEGVQAGDRATRMLTVTVFPYVYMRKVNEKVFWTKKKVEIGYRYQLFAANLPCLDPKDIPLETSEEEELDDAMVEIATKRAIELVKTVLPLAGPLGSLFRIADQVLVENR